MNLAKKVPLSVKESTPPVKNCLNRHFATGIWIIFCARVFLKRTAAHIFSMLMSACPKSTRLKCLNPPFMNFSRFCRLRFSSTLPTLSQWSRLSEFTTASRLSTQQTAKKNQCTRFFRLQKNTAALLFAFVLTKTEFPKPLTAELRLPKK